MSIPVSEQLKELRRELAQRRRVFPKWVQDGRLEQAEADRRIARLEAAIATVETAAAGERLL